MLKPTNIEGKVDPLVATMMKQLVDASNASAAGVLATQKQLIDITQKLTKLQASQQKAEHELSQFTAFLSLVGQLSPTQGQIMQFVNGAWVPAAGQSFSTLSSGTNTIAAMLIGSGASLAPTGGGVIEANELGGTEGIGNGAAASLEAPAQGTGGGPASLTATDWIEISINGTQRWIPLFE